MKLIAYLLMAVATMAGSISAATAYLRPLDGTLSDERLIGLTLAAPAGSYEVRDSAGDKTESGEAMAARLEALREAAADAEPAKPEPLLVPEAIEIDTPPLPEVVTDLTGTAAVEQRNATEPIAIAGDKLTAGMLELLREQGVENIKATTFEPGLWFKTWPSWVFAGSVLALIASALMVRMANRAAGNGASAETTADGIPTEPAAIALAIQAEVERVVADVKTVPGEREQLAMIVDRLGAVQRDLIPAFAASRPRIIGRMGMGGYAQVMDVFAASERRINRAWSAAADGHEDEALTSLHSADEVLPGLVERLKH